MAWNERLMALLSCKYVSEVVIDAPVGVDNTIIDTFSVSVVVPGINDYQRSISGQDTTLEVITFVDLDYIRRYRVCNASSFSFIQL